MRKALVILTVLLINTQLFGKSSVNYSSMIEITSMKSVVVEDGIDVTIETLSINVPTYLGSTYSINQNTVNISICYYVSVFTTMMEKFHTIHIPIDKMDSYIVNLSVYSSTSSEVCDYSVLEDSTSALLDTEEFQRLSDEIKVIPNPSNGFFEIKSEHYPVKQVKIYDMTGKQVKNSTALNYDIRNLDDGTYILVISTEKGDLKTKIVLKK